MYTVREIQSSDIGEDILIDCLASNNADEAMAAVQNPYATEAVLAIAALDEDASIRLLAVAHSTVADRTVLKLCKDTDLQVRKLALAVAERRGL